MIEFCQHRNVFGFCEECSKPKPISFIDRIIEVNDKSMVKEYLAKSRFLAEAKQSITTKQAFNNLIPTNPC